MRTTTRKLVMAACVAITQMATLASAEVRTFAGQCEIFPSGGTRILVGQFEVAGEVGSCPNQRLEFSWPPLGSVRTDYGIYVEFQRSEFGPGLTDKAFISLYDKAEGSLESFVEVFNAQVGNSIILHLALPDEGRLSCSGEIR